MSLNFDFSDMIARLGKEEYDKITDHPTEKGKWSPVTDILIWATMFVDLPGVREDTVDEFVYRINVYQKLHGALLVNGDGPIFVTEKDVRDHLGFTTNVTKKTRAQWLKRITDKVDRVCNLEGKSAREVMMGGVGK